LGKTWERKEEDECHGEPIKGRLARKRTNITRGGGYVCLHVPKDTRLGEESNGI
jgi:hypothetical protein